MANFLPRDEELFEKIAREHIQVDSALWTVIYHHIGDCIMAIKLLVYNYVHSNQPVPKDKAKDILGYTRRIIEVIQKITYHNRYIKDDEPDPLFQLIKKRDLKLDVITDDLFGNYVRNDIYVISLIAQSYSGASDPDEGIPVEDARKILDHIGSSQRFMEKLRQATSGEEEDKDGSRRL